MPTLAAVPLLKPRFSAPQATQATSRLSPADLTGTPLSPAELDFAARRMPVCDCPRLVSLSGPDRVHHRPACTYAAIAS